MAKRPSGKRRNETAYQYRIRRYKELHPGATTQEARGKPRREHVTRREREIEEHGMTLAQRRSVDNFAREQARKSGADVDSTIERFRDATREKGFDEFQRVRAAVRRMGRAKRARAARIFQRGGRSIDFTRASADRDARLAEMQELADDFFDDADDDALMYYH